MAELTAARSTVHSLWAHRFDEARVTSNGDMLPGLHGRTMEAIEITITAHHPHR